MEWTQERLERLAASVAGEFTLPGRDPQQLAKDYVSHARQHVEPHALAAALSGGSATTAAGEPLPSLFDFAVAGGGQAGAALFARLRKAPEGEAPDIKSAGDYVQKMRGGHL